MMERVIECEICGKVFATNIGNAKYCSKECRMKAKSILRASKTAELSERICVVCGTHFFAKRNQHICSEKCKEERSRALARKYKINREARENDEMGNDAFLAEQERRKKYRHTDPEALDRANRCAKRIGVSYGEYVAHRDTMAEERFDEWCLQRVIEARNRERAKYEQIKTR